MTPQVYYSEYVTLDLHGICQQEQFDALIAKYRDFIPCRDDIGCHVQDVTYSSGGCRVVLCADPLFGNDDFEQLYEIVKCMTIEFAIDVFKIIGFRRDINASRSCVYTCRVDGNRNLVVEDTEKCQWDEDESIGWCPDGTWSCPVSIELT